MLLCHGTVLKGAYLCQHVFNAHRPLAVGLRHAVHAPHFLRKQQPQWEIVAKLPHRHPLWPLWL